MDRLVKADVKEVNLNFIRDQKCSASFSLTNLMHTMSVAVSLSTTNPSFSFLRPFSILPPLSTSSFTLHLSEPSRKPPLSSPPDTIIVRSAMLPTGKAHQDDLRRLFSKPGPHIFKDAAISISLVGPDVVETLLSPPRNKSLEIAFLLLNAISKCGKSQLNDLLISASKAGNPYFVSALIDAGADVNYVDSERRSAMSVGVRSGNIELVQLLIDSGYKIDNSVDRVLHDAAAMNRVDLMKLLALGFKDIDANLADLDGRTALHVAAIQGHVVAIRFLIFISGNPDGVDKQGWTPLHFAAFGGHKEAVEYLLLNCSVSGKYAVNEDGKTPFALAMDKGHTHLYNILYLGDVLHRAARVGDIHGMKSCLAEGADVNERDQNGWTPLHRAAFKGRMESAKLLVTHGADVDAVDDVGHSPFRLAMESGHTKVAAFLIARGAKASLKSLEGLQKVDDFKLDGFKNRPSCLVSSLCREKEMV